MYALNASFIGADLKAAPAARTDDGRIWLLLVRKGVSRAQMFRVRSWKILFLGSGKNFLSCHQPVIEYARQVLCAKLSRVECSGFRTFHRILFHKEQQKKSIMQ